MTNIEETSSTWQSELEEILQQLRSETVKFALVGLVIAAMAILQGNSFFSNVFLNFAIMLALAGLAILSWLIQRYNPQAASWVIIIGTLGAIFLLAYQNSLGSILWLIFLPVGLTTLMMGFGFGITIALGCTILFWLLPDSILAISPLIRMIAIIGIWGTVGMLWLALRPLLTVIQFAWNGYQDNHNLIEKMRDNQLKLQETLEDLTNANKQLTRMTQQAEAFRKVAEEERHTKERFVANVSHELRTPLNMIVGFCEMITQEPDTYGGDIPQALLADLTVVLRNGQHLSSLINDVLDLSQLDAGRTALTKESVSMAEIIQAAVVAVRPLYDSKNLYLETKIPEDLPLVFCDRTRIREVILNLLSNAGRFTSSGGVKVEVCKNEKDVEISVSDTGPGITKENLQKIFQPFEQLENTVRRQYGGTGLGLSISKGFVELHGGKMNVKSQFGVGTTFSFSIPIDLPVEMKFDALRWFSPYHSFEPRYRSPHIKPSNVRPHIVVVEKGGSLNRILTRYLDVVEITRVENIEQAADALSQLPVQAILINDLQSQEAYNELNRSNILPSDIPVLICSVPGVQETTSSLGVSDYLIKPVSQEILYQSIDRLKAPIKTVLVVDDDPDSLQLVGRMLMAAGRDYRVLRTNNGTEALEILKRERPDLILLDLIMPEMDGFQFLANKEKYPEVQSIPVILISARDPLGQPIVSKTLLATSRDGLSASQLLMCLEALIAILSKGSWFAGQAPQEELSD